MCYHEAALGNARRPYARALGTAKPDQKLKSTVTRSFYAQVSLSDTWFPSFTRITAFTGLPFPSPTHISSVLQVSTSVPYAVSQMLGADDVCTLAKTLHYPYGSVRGKIFSHRKFPSDSYKRISMLFCLNPIVPRSCFFYPPCGQLLLSLQILPFTGDLSLCCICSKK